MLGTPGRDGPEADKRGPWASDPPAGSRQATPESEEEGERELPVRGIGEGLTGGGESAARRELGAAAMERGTG